MDTIQIILLVCIILGSIILFACLITIIRSNRNPKNDYEIDLDIDKLIELRLKKIDKNIEEFEKNSKKAIAYIDEKHQQNLIIEKNILEISENILKIKIDNEQLVNKNKISGKFLNPRNLEIIKLSKQGFLSAEIAEKLNIGQGEVNIVLELGKAR